MTSQADKDFDLLEVGIEGQLLDVPPLDGKLGSVSLPRKTLPVGLPPVLPEVREDVERYLTCLDALPIHDFQKAQHVLPRTVRPDRLLYCQMCPLTTTIQVERDPTSGKLLGYREEYLEEVGKTSRNSLSLRRQPDASTSAVRGSSANFPFWPGGMEEPNLEELTGTAESSLDQVSFDELLTVPPDLESGMTFESSASDLGLDLKPRSRSGEVKDVKEPAVLSLADILTLEDSEDMALGDSDKEEEKEEVETSKLELPRSESLENLVPEVERKEGVKEKPKPPPEKWAVVVDINTPVTDFGKQVPKMAYEYPFELDVFQKQAILHLERGDSVFVAAHTSAGKTVVAEYAIALSLMHKTRSIYTSPIKALSNQKYRDFKVTFGDVGLVTGDVQLNQTGACLIMTTEILRSMLYNGSDVIRDLEWVIFDEVHYINDSERGVVWEEVLIMLPDHVGIILLSATVPNTEEFANWVGRTKQKKIYVISTQKRPVPLEHFLYTGNSNKTSNELFLLVDSQGNFLPRGYNKAVDAKKERASKSSQSFGPKGFRGGNPAQDKNVWLSLIDMLRKKDKLPMVAFTFSKKKIEANAYALHSVDLTTGEEKSAVHIFFQACVKRLKGSDQQLPQVLQMADLLKRGVGIHHSGVLPILKEVVEMLFQRGLVKILFATETFAMGVNMPARTVVFDSIRKNDGTNFRNLLPGEYIQMAGRAGRRGLDATGTVIILCKGDVPDMPSLHQMMLGKPTKLESQFRLTYSMILNLLRVEELRVEDMMKRSYSEFHQQKDHLRHRQSLTSVLQRLKDQRPLECFLCAADLEAYYSACSHFHSLRCKIQATLLTHPAAIKALSPGRVVVVSNGCHRNVLGVVLSSSLSGKERVFTALVLADRQRSASAADSSSAAAAAADSTDSSKDEGKERKVIVTPVLESDLWLPEGPCWHDLVQLKGGDIEVITQKTIKIDADKIINDVKKRQQARFRDDPPGQSVSVATQELLRLSEGNVQGLPRLDPVKDFGLRDIGLVEECRSLDFTRASLQDFHCLRCPKFAEHFAHMREAMELNEEVNRLKFLLSDDSLLLLPEYQQRMQVLERMNYIDAQRAVQLKGRVACEISTHELMITELVFDNVLTELHPADIAALLSCMVFEQKHTSEPNLTEALKAGKEKIVEVAQSIGRVQKECRMQMAVEDYCAQFKFGLMEVVLEWARGMEFAEIMGLTDVQEGIVVRCIQRLHETLRDVRNAARIIGDPVLHQKMEESMNMVKRDIVFAASLYTQ